MKTAILTGASGGLGAALCEQYLSCGYRLFALNRRTDTPALTALKEKYQDHLTIIKTDVSNDDSVKAAAEEIAAAVDSLDVIINCSGYLPDDAMAGIEDVDMNKLMYTFNVNALGNLRLVKYNYGLLKNGCDPIVINISSAGASFKHIIEWDTRLEYPYGYCMSKAALNMGMAILQRYTNQDDVRVICVHPGVLMTVMNEGNPFQEDLIPPSYSAECIYRLGERERVRTTGNLFFNYDGEIFPY